MKKFIVSFCLLITILLPTFANSITEDSARIKAEHFFAHKKKASGRRLAKTTSSLTVSCVKKSSISENDDATYYIFNQKDNSGYVIISGDDCMPTLIGYSLENNIDVENMPEALKLMLGDYDLYVKFLRDNGKLSTRNRVGPLEPGTSIVGPYLKSTWGQTSPYNMFTPIIDKESGQHAPTGCVPTAAAQILYYYKWPQNSYYKRYNWNDMRDSYIGTGYGDAEKIAVANLMRDLGAIMGTTYKGGESGTGASSYFKIPGYKCTNITDLDSGLLKGPLVISVSEGKFLHAVVADGYDSNGFYHINWGWNGGCNGYYNIKDLAIVYENQEIHPSIDKWNTYLLEPDYENEKRIAIPAAFSGIETNCHSATKGDTITLTLKNMRLVSGSEFNGSISCVIFKKSEDYGNYYSKDGFYGSVLFVNAKSRCVAPSQHWDNNLEGNDVNLSITLGELSENGEYVIVPVYYNNSNWRVMFQFSDGTLAEDLPFEYQNGNYYFKEVPHGDFKIDVSQIVTASIYREKGNSNILTFLNNEGNNDFTGIMTATFVNANNVSDTKTIDYNLYVPANQSSRIILNTHFDFTGTYYLKEIEIWKKLSTGSRKTYLNKSINQQLFTILPKDNHTITTDFIARMNVEVLWKDHLPYVNDSIYKYEEACADFYAYSYDADTTNIDVELWAVPIEGDLSSLLKKKSYSMNSQSTLTKKIGGSTFNLSPGAYYLMAFGRCGNNTSVFWLPSDLTNVPDYNIDNIIYIFDSGIDIPVLKLHRFKQVDCLYYGSVTPNYAETEIENTSDVDYCGYSPSCLSIGNNIYMSVSSAPFRIKARQKAIIWPQLSQYKDYEETGGYADGILAYKVNNGVRDLIIPMEGDFFVNFTEKPENIISVSSGIAFYYKNNLSIKPSLGFYSKGTLKRSLWKNNEIIMNLDDLQTDSTYNTYKVCPEAAEIKDLPSGNYLFKVNLIDINGEHPIIVYPLIIDDKELPLTIEKVSFDTNRSFSYEGDMPVVVTIKNPTQQDVSTLVSTEIRRKVDGKNSWWVDSRELHPITLPAMQSTTINLNTHILSTSTNIRQDGTFKVYVNVCRTERESGHLDFGSSKGSDTIELPYVSNGITLNTYESHHIPTAYYTIDGKRVTTPPHGLYIVKYNDGSVKKMHR